ncbi:MAG: PA2778 family cysteine peptidase [Desulfobacterales bacterium]|jgi:tetratricopeptide (TPR) repeat protein|nr:PA2778 family cysteine peptidase [Desulfobacterales bacterium]
MYSHSGSLIWATALWALLAGCAGQALRWPPPSAGLPPHHLIANVPFFAQQEYQCGPAALAMGLAWSGLEVAPAELTPKVYTAALQGSLQPAMIAAARRLGRLAYVIRGPEALLREVAADRPVIVLQNLGLAWAPRWHYAVVVGYDTAADEVILHTGLAAQRSTSWPLFLNTWSRGDFWGLLVLKASELPATAEEGAYVEAAIGLENAGRLGEAEQAFRTALSRWPGNLAARMGIGNSAYAQGELLKAEAAFRKAAELHPRSGAAWNNLAHVLLKQGRRAEALEAAREAVALGGPLASTFEKTLEEILSSEP